MTSNVALYYFIHILVEVFFLYIYKLIIYLQILESANEDHHEGVISLARKPNNIAQSYSGCIVNGFRFNTRERDMTLNSFNHGVVTQGDEGDSTKNYYGTIENVIKITYSGENYVMLFQCNWFNTSSSSGFFIDEFGIPSIHKEKFLKSDDIFIFANQAEQVIYVDDLKKKGWANIIKTIPRDVFNITEEIEEDFLVDEEDEEDLEVDQEDSETSDVYKYDEQDEIVTLVRNQYEGEEVRVDGEDDTPGAEEDDISSNEEDEEEEEELLESDDDVSTHDDL